MSGNMIITWMLGQIPGPQPLPKPELPLPAEQQLPPPWWIYWAGGAVLLLLVILIIWLLLRPKPLPQAPARQPLTSAIRALNDLRARLETIPPQDMSHRVSQVLRRYLLERYAVPAMARTTREIFEGSQERLPGVPIPRAQGMWRERFEPVANLCDDMSFMPAARNSEEAVALIDQALERLQEERP